MKNEIRIFRHGTDMLGRIFQNAKDREAFAELQKKEEGIYNNKINAINGEIKSATVLIHEAQNCETTLTGELSNKLNTEDRKQYFRKKISYSFCGLVAIVIAGFFGLAFKKDTIATAIFSGERGIQFITVFLIIIAIILFGIMGILGDKELAALLGGLSGYILGRARGLRPSQNDEDLGSKGVDSNGSPPTGAPTVDLGGSVSDRG